MIKSLVKGVIDKQLYLNDIRDCLKGYTNLDYLEYVNGPLLVSLAETGRDIIHDLDGSNNISVTNPLYKLRDKTSLNYLNNLVSILSSTLNKKNFIYLINSSRKYLGMFVEKEKLKSIFDLILKHRSLFECSNLKLCIHSGAYNPITHSGHIETAKHFEYYGMCRLGDVSRLILWTFEENKYKPESNGTFNKRIKEIHRIFHNSPRISIFNYPGSTRNDMQANMYSMLSKLTDNKIRYCIGSDAFIKRINLYRSGDPTTKAIFSLENLKFYISVRAETNIIALEKAISESKILDRDVEVIGIQTKRFSGSELRQMRLQKRSSYYEGLWYEVENAVI